MDGIIIMKQNICFSFNFKNCDFLLNIIESLFIFGCYLSPSEIKNIDPGFMGGDKLI